MIEPVLAGLTFSQTITLLEYINTWMKQNKKIEKISRILFFLLRMNQVQLSSQRSCLMILDSLKENTRKNLLDFKDVIGFNLAAMNFLKTEIEARDDTQLFEVSEKLYQLKLEAARSQRTKRNYWEESSSSEESY